MSAETLAKEAHKAAKGAKKKAKKEAKKRKKVHVAAARCRRPPALCSSAQCSALSLLSLAIIIGAVR